MCWDLNVISIHRITAKVEFSLVPVPLNFTVDNRSPMGVVCHSESAPTLCAFS
uniref:Uncharacterized protein n=1 Tax=Rhizophora mucronata TaxID=61149 RepID=A0A2P2P017_RHIMU